ncbi:hypothetical protein U0070_000629 [Myodes glareolus]|uniref:Mediator of RNA polymerase II transcription subunit 27 n=1 Tax=Myodes glareolus TaxID=447135 RepID=A0AAW0IH18_MYOGA
MGFSVARMFHTLFISRPVSSCLLCLLSLAPPLTFLFEILFRYHATTALLHYQLPQMPDVVVRSFMTWLRSYIKLFQAPCQRCGKFLQDGLPPTWRDFRTLEAFHDTCRQ